MRKRAIIWRALFAAELLAVLFHMNIRNASREYKQDRNRISHADKSTKETTGYRFVDHRRCVPSGSCHLYRFRQGDRQHRRRHRDPDCAAYRISCITSLREMCTHGFPFLLCKRRRRRLRAVFRRTLLPCCSPRFSGAFLRASIMW